MKYDKFSYIYPPRPEVKVPPHHLDKFDNGQYVAQPKYNGSCCLVFTNGIETHVYNRHREELKRYSNEIQFSKLALSDKWYVYAGEYLNKSKVGEYGNNENDKYIIWDVLVWNGEHLAGTSLLTRLTLLENEFPCNRAIISNNGLEMYKHLCCTEFKGIYKAPSYMNDFQALYNNIVRTDLYEGLLLKKLDSKLQFGFQQQNNTDWQVKCRKTTKIYHF
jgi:ATP-dependent DNA ligase